MLRQQQQLGCQRKGCKCVEGATKRTQNFISGETQVSLVHVQRGVDSQPTAPAGLGEQGEDLGERLAVGCM